MSRSDLARSAVTAAWLRVHRADLRVAAALARTDVPGPVDRALPLVTRAADFSVLWFTVAGALAASRNRAATRAALRGLASIGAASLIANQGGKRLWPRTRPVLSGLPRQRLAFRIPTSGSFPSGHSASAAAFAVGAAAEQPRLAAPLGALAATVAFSRVYTGVHHPSDVLAGVALGAGVAALGTKAVPTARAARGRARSAEAPARPQEPRPTGQGVVLVLNPRSGGGRAAAVAEGFAEEQPDAKIRELAEDENVEDVMAEAAAAADVLAVAGGDGTVNAAARAAIAADRPLLVLPAGTLNHFARDLGIGGLADVRAALRDGTAIRVDVGRAGERIFLNTASVGSYPDFVALRERWQARIGKPAAAAFALIQTLRRTPPLQATVDGVERSLLMVFIGNGEYLPRGYVPRRRPRLDTGHLDVRIVESTGRESAWRLLGQAVSGRLVRDRRYSACQPERLDLVLDTDEPTLACDGEVLPTDRGIMVSVERQALTVYHRPPHSRR